MGKQGDKFITIEEAVSLIPDGCSITFSGFGHTLTPMAVIREMIRQRKGGLHVIGVGEAWAIDMLAGAGLVSKVWLSNFMFEGYGRCKNFSRAVEQGRIEVEDCSHYGQISRFQAGGTGLPFMPVLSMMGSDIEAVTSDSGFDKSKRIECPFTGQQLLALPAIKPDVAVIHASRADDRGNVQLFGHSTSIDEQVRASKTVIVTVEEIVPHEEISRYPELTLLPGFLVDCVAKVPYGAHPTGMYRYYSEDKKHMDLYMNASQSEEGIREYLDKYVYTVSDHWDYLKRMPVEHLLKLKADPYLGYRMQEA